MITLAAMQKRLAMPTTSWQLCLLAIVVGSVAALVIILFTLSIDMIQHLYLAKLHDYSSLDRVSRFDLPIFGVLASVIFFSFYISTFFKKLLSWPDLSGLGF